MEQRNLGTGGCAVGVLGLGTSTWGSGTSSEEAHEQARMLVESGGNLVDIHLDGSAARGAASSYVRDGIVGAGLRREVLVCVRTPARSSRREMLTALEDAVEATGVGHADMWIIDGWSPHVAWDEVVASLAVATASGRAFYAGLRPDDSWQAGLVGAGLYMQPERPPLAALLAPGSLLDLETWRPVSDVADALGCAMIAASPLAGGVLTGKYRHATPPDSRGAGERHAGRLQHYRDPWAWPVVEALFAAAEGLGVSPGALALAWARDRAGVATVLTGARTVHQWRAALDSARVTMPSEIRHVLDEVAANATRMGEDGLD